MHFVAALDDVPEMRAVLTLFEGVATGRGRRVRSHGRQARGDVVAPRPRPRQRHRQPPQRARRARTPIVNIVGDQATYHQRVRRAAHLRHRRVARNVSGWIRGTTQPESVARDAADAVAAALAPPGRIATLILPADTSWLEAGEPAARRCACRAAAKFRATRSMRSPRRCVPANRLRCCSAARPSANGDCAPRAASRRQPARSCSERCSPHESSAVRVCRRSNGSATSPSSRSAQLDGVRHLVLVDTPPPVSFFAYPEKPSLLVPDGCEVHTLALGGDDVASALEHLADALGADAGRDRVQPAERPDRTDGRAHRGVVARGARCNCCPKARSSRRGADRRPVRARARPRAALPRLADAHRRMRSGWACRSPPVPPSPAPIEGS